jgi:hypothetical protein
MPLIPDRVAQIIASDKMSRLWELMVSAGVPSTDFFEEVTVMDDDDMEIHLASGTVTVDTNLREGTGFSDVFRAMLSALRVHLSAVGSYSSLAAYLAARGWRVHEYAAALWAAAGQGTLTRGYVYPALTPILTYTQGGSAAATALAPGVGGARCKLVVSAGMGALEWVPEIYTVLETPATALASNITAVATSIVCADTSELPASGFVLIGDEAISYTGNADDTLTGCTRGALGTVATTHAANAAVRQGFIFEPTIRASERALTPIDVYAPRVTAVSAAGGTTLNSMGIGTTVDDGWSLLITDRTCPELLTADCDASDTIEVADTSAFRPGDYILVVTPPGTIEGARILDVNHHDKEITLTDVTTGTFTVADGAFICLAFASLAEGADLAFDDLTITVDDASVLPEAGTLRIDDEEMTYDGVLGDDITITARGVNGTVATAHADLSPVILVQTGTYPGHNEVGTVATAAADALTMDAALKHTYWLAADIAPLIYRAVSAADGTDGTAGDAFTLYAYPDRDIEKTC